MGPVGVPEMVIIFIVALVLFGPKKLPELGRTIGKAITEFRRASNELKSTFEREMQTLERENSDFREVAKSFTGEIQSSYDSTHHDAAYHDYGAYNSESHDSTATHTSTVGVSAPSDAESQLVETPSTGAMKELAPATNGTVPRTPGTELATASSRPAGHFGEPELSAGAD